MNLILLLFAFPVATIIFSISLQKILKNPIIVALNIFATFLIVTFTAFDESFLIYAILYTIMSYITASLVGVLKCTIRRIIRNQDCENISADTSVNVVNESENNINVTYPCRRYRR